MLDLEEINCKDKQAKGKKLCNKLTKIDYANNTIGKKN